MHFAKGAVLVKSADFTTFGRIGKDSEGLARIGKDWEGLGRISMDLEGLGRIGEDLGNRCTFTSSGTGSVANPTLCTV